MDLESVLRRDRTLIIGAVAGISVLAWWYMAVEARAMALTGVCQCFGLKMSGPDLRQWGGVELAGLTLMWTEMMIAMMLPSALPMLLTFAAVNRRRKEREEAFVPTAFFLGGYLAVWAGFSLVVGILQWELHRLALITSMMEMSNQTLGGVVLIGTGLFQWTRWKNACLQHCRSPLSFLMTDWREGRKGAWTMGLRHGWYCTGCCWLLMLVLFVVGVMNLVWIAVISVLVLLEKVLKHGLIVSRVSGVVLIAWGLAIL